MALLLIDGYNAIRRIPRFRRVEGGGLASGREAFLMALEEYAAASGHAAIVVFDGAGRPAGDAALSTHETFAGVDVLFSKRGQSADTMLADLLRRLRAGEVEGYAHAGAPGEIIVISDDIEVRDAAFALGGFARSPDMLDEAMRGVREITY